MLEVDKLDHPTVESDVAIRESYLKLENRIRTIGTLTVFFGGLFGLAVAAVLFGGGSPGTEGWSLEIVAASAASLIPVLLPLATGIGLRRLQRWSRLPAIFFFTCLLVGIPIGTFIGGYVLYCIAPARSRTVFSRDYAGIIAATPQFQYKTPGWVWGGILLIVGFFGFAISTGL